MSLSRIAGKVGAITNGSAIGNKISSGLYANGDFLRNTENDYSAQVSDIRAALSIASDVGGGLGLKNSMYVIGEISPDFAASLSDEEASPIGRWVVNQAATAVSYWRGSGAGYQQGVRIDGFDNFKGDISVGLPDNPIIYQTKITDNIVRNPNRLTMRVYVDLFHSDDIVDNLKQAALNSLGGLPNRIFAAAGFEMNRVQQALDDLKWIQENGRPFKVYTPHGVYDNMMIERIQPVNDQKMNEILAADITFKEIVPSYSLGNAEKAVGRNTPSAPASNFAKALGWI